MEPEFSEGRNSNVRLLEELEFLSQSLYRTNTFTPTRRTASLDLPRNSTIPIVSSSSSILTSKYEAKPEISQSMRMFSSSPLPFMSKRNDHGETDRKDIVTGQKEIKMVDYSTDSKVGMAEKKGFWNWKPIRALSHIRMQKLSCLFTVDVVSVQGLPLLMNGTRLSVCVRKKETKDGGAVTTMPAKVSQGVAEFEETLFVKCHVYFSIGSGRHPRFESRVFLIYVFAFDDQELDFGKSLVDLSHLIQESMEKNFDGERVRQWDASYALSGKAKGGELTLKLGFQMMDKDGGLGIYSQANEGFKAGRNSWASFGHKQSKTSFSIPSRRMARKMETPNEGRVVDFKVIDEFNLDDDDAPLPSSSSSVQKAEEPLPKVEDHGVPEYVILDKGIEIQDKTSPIDQAHWRRLPELDSIVEQMKTLESSMEDGNSVTAESETERKRLDPDEQAVTKEFLRMLEKEEHDKFKVVEPYNPQGYEKAEEVDSKVYLPELGKRLGCIVQTKDGGYFASMNPFNVELSRKETPKLAMQLSKPLIVLSQKPVSGFEMFQRMAAIGIDELSSEIISSMPLDELLGKTAEQISFEGVASSIMQGKNTEAAVAKAARTMSTIKTMAASMSTGRKERISTGIWSVNREAVTMGEILAFSIQKIEAMAVEALKIQAEMTEEDAPFEVSPLLKFGKKDLNRLFASSVSLDDLLKKETLTTRSTEGEPSKPAAVTLSVSLQLRDPLRRYEAVGGPMIVLIQANRAEAKKTKDGDNDERFKVTSLHVGGLKVGVGEKSNIWDAEKQRLTATLWLVENGLGKAGKRWRSEPAKGKGSLWSISSRIVADMWLKQRRNPDVKFLQQQ